MKKIRVVGFALLVAAAALLYCFLFYMGATGDGSGSTPLTFGDALLLVVLVPGALGVGLMIGASLYAAIDDLVTDCLEAGVDVMVNGVARSWDGAGALISWLVPPRAQKDRRPFPLTTPISVDAGVGAVAVPRFDESPTSLRLRQELVRVWRRLDREGGETVTVPRDHRTLIRTMVNNLGDGKLPGQGINLELPWESVPAWRVALLERWLRECPDAAWSLVTLLAAGVPESEAWSVAEGV
jgi:hypothetical protein